MDRSIDLFLELVASFTGVWETFWHPRGSFWNRFWSHFGGLGGCFGDPGLPRGPQRRQGGKSNRESGSWALRGSSLGTPFGAQIEKKSF